MSYDPVVADTFRYYSRIDVEDRKRKAQEMVKEERFHTLLAGGLVEDRGTHRLCVGFGDYITRMNWDEETDELQRQMAEARHNGEHEKLLTAAVKLADWMIEQTRNLA